jgi:spermidine/putrescine transport system permease protein
VIVPFWTSFVIRTYAWLGILGPQGHVNDFVSWTGLSDRPLELAFDTPAIIIGIVYNYLPLMIFPLFVSLDRIDARVLEAARDLGAGSVSVFRRVIFPQALPGLVAGVIVVGVPAAGEYVVPAILGGGKTLMFGNIIAAQFGASFVWPFGAALATALTGLLLVFIAATLGAARRAGMERAL